MKPAHLLARYLVALVVLGMSHGTSYTLAADSQLDMTVQAEKEDESGFQALAANPSGAASDDDFDLLWLVGVLASINNSDPLEAPLSPEEVSYLDSLPSVNWELLDIVLPNGENVEEFLQRHYPGSLQEPMSLAKGKGAAADLQSTQPLDIETDEEFKHLLVSLLTLWGRYFVDDLNFQYLAGENEQIEPKQDGLAYSWGQKKEWIREPAPGKDGECTEFSVHGLDCSGLIYRMFQNAGISIPLKDSWADNQRKPENLNKWLKQTSPSDYGAHLVAEDIGQIPPSEFQTGDIIYWERLYCKTERCSPVSSIASHIGIVLEDRTGTKVVIQSNGTSHRGNNCSKNYSSEKRGPRTVEFSNSYYFGDTVVYGIVRLKSAIPEIEGIYDLESYRGNRTGGVCGEAEGCGSPPIRIDSGTLEFSIENYRQRATLKIWLSFQYDGVWTPNDKPFAINGEYYLSPRTPNPTKEVVYSPEADFCQSGESRYIPDIGYCTKLPPGLMFDFRYPNGVKLAPFGVALFEDDGVTVKFISSYGGATVWKKRRE